MALQSTFSASDVVAVAAALIALCSLGATIWQGWISRSHNRLSVRPMLVWVRDRTLDESGITLRFSIKNLGVGPAIVKEQSFKLNGDVFALKALGGDYVRDVAMQALGSRFSYVLRRHGLPGIESAIPPGGECIVAELEFPGANEQVMEALHESTDVSFSLRYESLYGERRTLTT